MPKSHSRASSSAGRMDPCTAARAQQLEVSGCFPPPPHPITAVPVLLCRVLLAPSSCFGRLGGDAASWMQPNWWNNGNPPITHTELSPSAGTRGAVVTQGPGQSLYVLPAHTGPGESSTLLLTRDWQSTGLPQPDAARTESFKI